MAQEGARDTGAYISGQTGNFRLESPNLDATGALQAVYAGYRFSPYFAVEGGWSYASGIGGGNPDDISGRVDYVSARAIGRYPFGEVAPGLSLIAGVGLHYIDMHMTYMGVSTADTDMRHGYLVGGEMVMCGRIKDMIIVGGANVYPAEVEAVLNTHPAVVEAAVIGIPDDRWGEAVKAVISPKTDAGEVDTQSIIDWARERIAGFKVPKSVDVIPELPRNASGKLLKNVLRGEGDVSFAETM